MITLLVFHSSLAQTPSKHAAELQMTNSVHMGTTQCTGVLIVVKTQVILF